MSAAPHKIFVANWGGDCAGLNNAIYALVRGAEALGWEVYGARGSFNGLLNDEYERLTLKTISPFIQQLSGTFLGEGRDKGGYDPKNTDPHYHERFFEKMKPFDTLVMTGGDGSLALMHEVFKKTDLNYFGIPKTIDLDVAGTEYTLGADTAINQNREIFDVLRQTGHSHESWFLVQLMGRTSGALALHSGIVAQANAILLPELPWSVEGLIAHLNATKQDFQTGFIAAAEGVFHENAPVKSAIELRAVLAEKTGLAWRVNVPEHLQRGGTPTARDRLFATQSAAAVLHGIQTGQRRQVVILKNNQVQLIPIETLLTEGDAIADVTFKGLITHTAHVEKTHPLVTTARMMNIYIGDF